MRKCLQLIKCSYRIINYIVPPTYQDLKIAVMKGDIERIDLLIENGVSLLGKGQTILHFCIVQRNLDILQKFCIQFPDIINERNDDGDNPFMMAIFHKYKEAIDYLGRLTNLKICDNNGNTAFMIAAANGDLQTLTFLLSRNKQCMYAKNFEGQNALHRACFYGQIQTVSFLIRKTHLKFAMKDQKGNTALHLACKGLSFGVIRYIIKKVKNWEDTLMLRNKNQENPIDLMIQSINKIGDKSLNYTRQELQIVIFGSVIENNEDQSEIMLNYQQINN